jgi:hypothetical protein
MMGRPSETPAPKAAREWAAAVQRGKAARAEALAAQRWPDRAKQASAEARVRRHGVGLKG